MFSFWDCLLNDVRKREFLMIYGELWLVFMLICYSLLILGLNLRGVEFDVVILDEFGLWNCG